MPAALPPDLTALLRRLDDRRSPLLDAGTTLYRAAHTSETGGLFSLERAADAGVLSLYAELSADDEGRLAAACGEALRLRAVYLKRRPQEARHRANVERARLSPPLPVWGEDLPQLVAHEAGVPFLIRPGPDLSTGLFTDARPARQWARAHAPAGGAVLNTFAYTCGFGLMAALAGAGSVKNLDLSRRVLEWGRENYALSGLDAPQTDFISGDVFDWLRRLTRQGRRYELLVLDPPSFARSGGEVWRSERDYARLAALARPLLAPGGTLLALCNHAGLSGEVFRRMLAEGAPDLRVRAALGAGEDYPGADHLKVLALS